MHASLFASLLFIACCSAARASEPAKLHDTLEQLSRAGRFSGAVVVRGADGVRFARGYGPADPFEGRAFTPDTPADSGSLAKPVTSAAVLLLARDGKIDLDAPVRKYLPEFPQAFTTVRHLLSHSAGLELKGSPDGLANKSNSDLLATVVEPLFPPGTGFHYCNLCSVTQAILIERVAGVQYLEFVRKKLGVPSTVSLRPKRLADWKGRAIGYRRSPDGKIERFDSWEDELFYGTANFSISAAQLAEWGSQWWQPELQSIFVAATTTARIGQGQSGLTLGNWYCAKGGRRCHYLGHHEGFHHMLYWDANRRVSVAMMSNNALAAGLQQRLQRALVDFVEGDPGQAQREISIPLPDIPAPLGRFQFPSGEKVEIVANGNRRSIRRAGIEYPAYPIGSGMRYVPGLDAYLAGAPDERLRLLTLYEDLLGSPASN
jgi:CubicO group peptidase (beta-lactamase class C family)